jgi:hypothetical protein
VDPYRAVFVLIHVQRTPCVLPPGLLRFSLPIHATPTPNDPLDVLRGADTAPDVLAGCAGRVPDAPAQPVRARFEAVAPAPARVELADEIQQPRGRGFEVCGQLGYFVAQLLVLRRTVGQLNIHGSTSLLSRL